MDLYRPNRRELLQAASLALGLAAAPPALASASPGALRFLVLGDWGRDGAYWQIHVARAMKALSDSLGTEFVVTTGDNFYPWGVKTARDPQWESSFERIYDPSLGSWYAVPGNHDYAGLIEAQVERTSRSDRWQMPNYWHDLVIARPGLPAVHLFFIDTVAWKGESAMKWAMFSKPPDAQRQLEQRIWLTQKLQSSTAPVKLVFGHHPIYSVGKYGGQKRMEDLDVLLRRHNVSAYVNGHDHTMYHITHGPMHYICSGAGSEMRPGYKGGPAPGCVHQPCFAGPPAQSPDPVWHAYFGKLPGTPFNMEGGVALFEVTAAGVNFTFYDRHTRPRHRAVLARTASAATAIGS